MEQRLDIIINIMMQITNCSYSDAYEIIINTSVFKQLEELDYSTLYDSPQANLSSIGKELREKDIELGYLITDANIKKAMFNMRSNNSHV